jgi:tRNA(His) 5'-end guanylyltransferase
VSPKREYKKDTEPNSVELKKENSLRGLDASCLQSILSSEQVLNMSATPRIESARIRSSFKIDDFNSPRKSETKQQKKKDDEEWM